MLHPKRLVCVCCRTIQDPRLQTLASWERLAAMHLPTYISSLRTHNAILSAASSLPAKQRTVLHEVLLSSVHGIRWRLAGRMLSDGVLRATPLVCLLTTTIEL